MILKWAIAAVLIVGGVPVNRQLFLLNPEQVKTEADCLLLVEETRIGINKESPEAVLVAKCVELPWTPPPKTLPHDKKSEVAS